MIVPFVGPSYALNRKAVDTQRSVNLFPVANEAPGGKSGSYLDSVPGLTVFSQVPLTWGDILFAPLTADIVDTISPAAPTTNIGPTSFSSGGAKFTYLSGAGGDYVYWLANKINLFNIDPTVDVTYSCIASFEDGIVGTGTGNILRFMALPGGTHGVYFAVRVESSVLKTYAQNITSLTTTSVLIGTTTLTPCRYDIVFLANEAGVEWRINGVTVYTHIRNRFGANPQEFLVGSVATAGKGPVTIRIKNARVFTGSLPL